jgi:hypothetical protein
MAPDVWTGELTRELLELLWLVEATLALEPALEAILDEVVSDALAGRPERGESVTGRAGTR